MRSIAGMVDCVFCCKSVGVAFSSVRKNAARNSVGESMASNRQMDRILPVKNRMRARWCFWDWIFVNTSFFRLSVVFKMGSSLQV